MNIQVKRNWTAAVAVGAMGAALLMTSGCVKHYKLVLINTGPKAIYVQMDGRLDVREVPAGTLVRDNEGVIVSGDLEFEVADNPKGSWTKVKLVKEDFEARLAEDLVMIEWPLTKTKIIKPDYKEPLDERLTGERTRE